MLKLLSRWLIADYRNYNDSKVRRAYGVLCGIVGVVLVQNPLVLAAGTGKILGLLTMMELKGILKRLPGKRITLK